MIRVFKWLTAEGGAEFANVYSDWFAHNFEPHNFQSVDKLLLCFIKYCALLRVVPQRSYLITYLDIEAKKDIKKYSIRTDTLSSYNYNEATQLEAATKIIREAAILTYDTYVQEDLSERAFKIDMHSMMSSFKAEASKTAMIKAYEEMSTGFDPGDVTDDLRTKLGEIDESFDISKIADTDLDNSYEEESTMEFLAKTGVPCIDGDIGGIYSKLIYTINAQPAGGKTRFSLIHFVYPMLTSAKKDVVFYSTELTASQVKNILIAYHITVLYGGRKKIPDSILNKPSELSPEQLQIYEAAKIDLFESGANGRFIVKDDCIIETMEDEFNTVNKISKNVGLLVIDYMGLVRSAPKDKYERTLDEYKVITEGYKIARRLVKKNKMAAVCVNQYNTDGIDAAFAGKPIRPGHVQGGNIVQRHTDYDLNLTYTEEQKLANVRMLSTAKARGSKGFSGVMFTVDLAVSIFRQESR